MKYTITTVAKLSRTRHVVLFWVFGLAFVKKTQPPALNVPLPSLYNQYKAELLAEIKELETQECFSAIQYELNTRILIALNEELLLLEGRKLLKIID